MTKTHRQLEVERQTSLVGLDPTPLDPIVVSRYQEFGTEVVIDDVVNGIPRIAVAEWMIREICAMVCCFGRRNVTL
jgi:hypothetical protein